MLTTKKKKHVSPSVRARNRGTDLVPSDAALCLSVHKLPLLALVLGRAALLEHAGSEGVRVEGLQKHRVGARGLEHTVENGVKGR